MKSIADSEAQLRESTDQLEALLLRPEQLHQSLERLKREQAKLRAVLEAKDKDVAAVEASIAAIPTEVDRYARAQQEAEERVNRTRDAQKAQCDLVSVI